jgi:hypothetical protein
VGLLSVLPVAVLATAPVRLEYSRADDAAACVAEDDLRAAVVRRLGYVPFDEAAPDVLQVAVARKPPGFVGRLVRTTPFGPRKGERELYTPRADCADLGEALAFALSVAIDPASMFRPPPDAGTPTVEPAPDAGVPEPEPAPEDAGSPPDAGLRPVPPGEQRVTVTTPVELEAGAAVGATYGVAPVASLSVRAEVRWRWRLISLAVQLRGDLLGSLTVGGGNVNATPLQLGVAPCLHFRGLTGCALVSGGVVIGSAAGLPGATTRITPIFLLGARLAYELELGRFRPFVFAEGGGAVARTSLFVGHTEAWTSPPAWGGGGLGFFFGPP